MEGHDEGEHGQYERSFTSFSALPEPLLEQRVHLDEEVAFSDSGFFESRTVSSTSAGESRKDKHAADRTDSRYHELAELSGLSDL